MFRVLQDTLKGNDSSKSRKKAILEALDNGEHLKVFQIRVGVRPKFKEKDFLIDDDFFINVQPLIE